jgi:hypothetical protein
MILRDTHLREIAIAWSMPRWKASKGLEGVISAPFSKGAP